MDRVKGCYDSLRARVLRGIPGQRMLPVGHRETSCYLVGVVGSDLAISSKCSNNLLEASGSTRFVPSHVS